jgi:ABC-type uncharacterized transport system substrate-binding protein
MMYVGFEARRDGAVNVDFTLRVRGDYEVLVLIESGVPYHRMALDGAVSTMPGRVATLAVEDTGPEMVRQLRERLDRRPSAVLAIGETAARLARRHIRDVPVVYAMVPAPMDSGLTTTNLCGVPLTGGFEAQIQHLRHVMPEARRIGTIYDPHRIGRPFREARQATNAAGMELIAAHVNGDNPDGIRDALVRLESKQIDAFLLLMDPRLMDADAFSQVADFALSHGIVLVVPDASLVVPGRAFSFVPGFWDLGAHAGSLIRRIVEGRVQPSQIGVSYPTRESHDQIATRLQTLTFRDVLPGREASVAVQLARDE